MTTISKYKLAIVGGRNFNDYNLMKKILTPHLSKLSEIISGGANGADTLAEKFAKENNLNLKSFIPDWDKFGKSAGYIRNSDIIKNSDIVIAFWDGKSKGTKHSIELAKKFKKPMKIIYF